MVGMGTTTHRPTVSMEARAVTMWVVAPCGATAAVRTHPKRVVGDVATTATSVNQVLALTTVRLGTDGGCRPHGGSTSRPAAGGARSSGDHDRPPTAAGLLTATGGGGQGTPARHLRRRLMTHSHPAGGSAMGMATWSPAVGTSRRTVPVGWWWRTQTTRRSGWGRGNSPAPRHDGAPEAQMMARPRCAAAPRATRRVGGLDVPTRTPGDPSAMQASVP